MKPAYLSSGKKEVPRAALRMIQREALPGSQEEDIGGETWS
jgi:hypothetical protein